MNKILKSGLLVIAGIMFFSACNQAKKDQAQFSGKDIDNVITEMTATMIHDITNPPLAARYFSYACLAGYEVVSQNNPSVKSMHGILNQYPDIKKPDSIKGYAVQLSALLAMIKTAEKIQPSGYLMSAYEQKFLDSCKKSGFSDDEIESSVRYASYITKQIMAYVKTDGYSLISNYERYTPTGKEGDWYPTPPGYIAAVEPYFKKVRPFLLDSSTQYKPAPPVAFSKEKQSPFFKQLLLNYVEEQHTMSQDHKVIAAFWDCNPFAVQNEGHLMIGIKKISPGAHWLGITGIACEKAKKSFNESMEIFTSVSVGLMDAFICCWDEKYRSNRIRPETAIRKYKDVEWQPLLQTPPFPEYPSGHSVVSASSSVILTHYFGDNFNFTDNVEVNYGLPARTFTSFTQAAEEAAISRFYGGIHFMDAIDNGFAQGKQVGHLTVEKLK
jgi:hypothetical protein